MTVFRIKQHTMASSCIVFPLRSREPSFSWCGLSSNACSAVLSTASISSSGARCLLSLSHWPSAIVPPKSDASHHHSTSLFFLVPFQSPLPSFRPFLASSASPAPEPSANLRLTRQCSPSCPLLRNLHRTRTKLEPGWFSSNTAHIIHTVSTDYQESHLCHRLTKVICRCGFLTYSKIPLPFARLRVVLVTDFSFHVTMLLLQFQVHLFFMASSPRDHELVFRDTCDTVFLFPSEDHLTHECA